jgi:hypothetical protein
MVIAGALLFPAIARAFPTIKATVGAPVLQELMGGCSLRCAFHWETTAVTPDGHSAPIYSLDDSYAASAWLEGGVGSRLVMQFPKKLSAEMNGNIPFYGFDIADGRIVPLGDFKQYGRVKKMRMFYDDKPLYDIIFADTWRWQHVTFDDIMASEGDRVAFEILEIYPGSKSPAAAITEFVLQGAH